MIKTYSNAISTEQLAWLHADMQRRLPTESFKRNNDPKWIKSAFGLDNWEMQEERIELLDDKDPARQMLAEIIYKIIPKQIWFYAAYQRQHVPQAVHVDAVSADTDLTWAFTGLIPLDENTNDVYKTVIWNKQCVTRDEFENFTHNTPIESLDQTVSNKDHYDIDHCLYGDFAKWNHIEIEGAYNYELGSVGLFTRTHAHCSSNWRKYNYAPYKDIIILHCS